MNTTKFRRLDETRLRRKKTYTQEKQSKEAHLKEVLNPWPDIKKATLPKLKKAMANCETKTLCDICGYYEFKGIVVWGRELNSDEKKLNADLKAEGKDYFCTYFDKYFNKSFYKHKYHCEAESLEGLDEETG